MTLTEIRPSIETLPRNEKVQLMRELFWDLGGLESIAEVEYPWWTPFDAHDAAEVMMKALEDDARRAN